MGKESMGLCKDRIATDFDVYTSNVFTAEDDEYIRRIGIGTATPNCTVEYAVYLLNDDFSSPTDGVKAIESEVTFDYAGYHVIDLGKLVPVGKEQNYSIVARSLREDGKISVPVNADLNKNGYESLYEYRKSAHIEKNGTDEGFDIKIKRYNNWFVNPGESFIGVRTKNGIEWADYSDIITTVTSDNDELLNNGFCYDNFTLRAYTEPITEGDISAATGNTEAGVADGELLDIITVSFKDALGIDGNINGCPYIGRDIYAVNTDSGVRFYKITAADIDTWRRTGKLNAAPVTMDEKLDGLRLVGNFSDKFLDRTDYILLYLKDYNFMDWDNQYRYIVRYNEESNSIEYVASGDVDEIRGVTESGYAYRYENVNSVCFIYITDLATGKVRRVSMDYSSLGEGYSPNFAIASYVEQDKIVFHQWDWNDVPTGLNKGALWSIDVTTGEIVRLEKHDTYIYNGNRENVFYLYNDGELGALRVYMHNTGEIYDVTELGYRIAGDGTAWMMSAIGSNFYGTTVVIEYCNEDQTQFAYALADIAENKLLTEIIPYEGRNGFTLGADGSLLIRNGDKWDLYRADGSLRARFDDISDVGDQPYVFVIDGSEGFFINEGNKRVSAAIDREGILGVAYTGGNGMYHAGLEDGSEVFVTWAQPKPAGSDENPATGTSGFAGMLAVMCVPGLAAAVVRKKK